MFKKTLLLVLLVSILLSGCGTQTEQNDSTAAVDAQDSVTGNNESVSEQETVSQSSGTSEKDTKDHFSDSFESILAERNGKELEPDELSEMAAFFKTEKSPLPNTFLTVAFQNPSDIDVLAVFYNGLTSTPSDLSEEEKTAVWEAAGLKEDRIEIQKLIPSEMDTDFQKYTGHSLTDAQKRQLEELIYLPQYEAYYSCHSDSGLAHVTFTRGCIYTDKSGEEYLALEYFDMDVASEDNRGIVLMRKAGGNWLIQANERP